MAYDITGDKDARTATQNFFDIVTQHHSFATGGSNEWVGSPVAGVVPVVHGAEHAVGSRHSRTQRSSFCPAVTSSGKLPITWRTPYGRCAWKFDVMARNQEARWLRKRTVPMSATDDPLLPSRSGTTAAKGCSGDSRNLHTGAQGGSLVHTVVEDSYPTKQFSNQYTSPPERMPRSTTYSRSHVPSSAGPGTVSARFAGLRTPSKRHAFPASQ